MFRILRRWMKLRRKRFEVAEGCDFVAMVGIFDIWVGNVYKGNFL